MDRTTDNDADEWRSPLVDVSDMSLEDLTSRNPEGALAQSLRRLAAERDEPGEPIAGFNSAL
ncbi:FxSxx-COOH cyclophane-containing RiPP peptide [Actinoplanes sp. CA-030573]|uniref:FxSxx-COOH cyclophane-containing RiPP peptide n=1 Tax=Actinoplanes sp. CA-030573 TaxID=3239898 RepID=UPI003D8D2E6F